MQQILGNGIYTLGLGEQKTDVNPPPIHIVTPEPKDMNDAPSAVVQDKSLSFSELEKTGGKVRYYLEAVDKDLQEFLEKLLSPDVFIEEGFLNLTMENDDPRTQLIGGPIKNEERSVAKRESKIPSGTAKKVHLLDYIRRTVAFNSIEDMLEFIELLYAEGDVVGVTNSLPMDREVDKESHLAGAQKRYKKTGYAAITVFLRFKIKGTEQSIVVEVQLMPREYAAIYHDSHLVYEMARVYRKVLKDMIFLEKNQSLVKGLISKLKSGIIDEEFNEELEVLKENQSLIKEIEGKKHQLGFKDEDIEEELKALEINQSLIKKILDKKLAFEFEKGNGVKVPKELKDLKKNQSLIRKFLNKNSVIEDENLLTRLEGLEIKIEENQSLIKKTQIAKFQSAIHNGVISEKDTYRDIIEIFNEAFEIGENFLEETIFKLQKKEEGLNELNCDFYDGAMKTYNEKVALAYYSVEPEQSNSTFYTVGNYLRSQGSSK